MIVHPLRFLSVLACLALSLAPSSVFAQFQVYVDEAGDFFPSNPTAGSTVTWKPGTADEVTGLTFGTDAFTSVQNAVDGVASNGTVFIAAGSYAEGTAVSIRGRMTLQGDGASVTTLSGNNSHQVVSIPSSGTTIVTIDGIAIVDGFRSSGGGGISNGGTLTLSNAIVSGHRATSSNSQGGAIFNSEELTILNSLISGNSASGGGAISNSSGGAVTLINSTISGNTAGLSGGGVFNLGGTLTVTNSTISGNMANQNNSNIADGGGGIANRSGTLTVTNSTISGNSAQGAEGGGIYNNGTASLFHATVTGNAAGTNDDGGGIFHDGSAAGLTVSNTIVAGNTARNSPDIDGFYTPEGINFIGEPGLGLRDDFRDGTDLSFASTMTAIGDLIETTLADNGGPTLTHRLKTGSPAIDAGDNAATTAAGINTDQRGTLPIANTTVDIGSVEFLTAPEFVSSSPASGSSAFQLNASVMLTFDQVVEAGSGIIHLRRSDNNAILPSSTSFADEVAIIVPNVALPEGIQFYVEVEADAVVNIVGTPFVGINDPSALNFTTCFLNVYVDAVGDFSPANPSEGDPVIWNGTGGAIGGLFFGRDAFTSVQEAIDEVCDGGTVFVAAGTYLGGSQLEIAKNVTIRGDGEALTFLSGNDAHRVIHLSAAGFGNPNYAVSIGDLTVTNGRVTGDGGGLLNEGADLTISNTEFSNNLAAGGSGGGISHDGQGSLTVTDSTFAGNLAQGSSFSEGGGGIFLSSFNLSHQISRCLFSGNVASGSSGGGLLSDGSNASVTVKESTFIRNFASNNGDGGGLANRGGGVFTVDACTFTENAAQRVSSGSSDGGGILAVGGEMLVINSTLSGNQASRGDGGGISQIGGSLTVMNSTISGNTASTLFGSNPVGGRGPGIDNSGGTLSVIHSTITGNSVSSNSGGGGISNINPGGTQGAVTLINSIVAGNFRFGSEPRDIAGSFTSIGVNFIGDLTGSTGMGTGTNLTFNGPQTINDLLDTTLRDNGGTTFTHDLFPGSLAVNVGSNSDLPVSLTTDQRGFARVVDTTVDLGAVEFLPAPVLVSSEPASGARSIENDGEIVLTFDREIFAGTGAIIVRRADTNTVIPASVVISGTTVTVTLDATLSEGVGFYIEVEANALLNAAGEAAAPINDPSTLSYVVCYETTYVAPTFDFEITTNQGASGLDAGDTVTWISSSASVTGLVFGANAFSSVQSAVDVTCDGGTLFLAPGTYREGAEITISRDLSILGDRDEGTELTRSTNFGATNHRILNIEAGTEVVLDRLTVREGRVTSGQGAGILNDGNLTISNCTLRRNFSNASGGGVANESGASLIAINSTFSDNQGINSFGGGIYNRGAATIINCTFTNNRAGNQGGGIYNLGGTLTVTNTIIAGNTNANAPDISGNFTSTGVNFIGDLAGASSSGTGSNLTFASTSTTLVDLIDPSLTDNGGGTFTHALPSGSPARNAGSNADLPMTIVTDQRNAPRTLEMTVDIGAVEFLPPLITTTNTAFYSENLASKISVPDLLASITGGIGSPLSLVSVSNPSNEESSTQISGDFIIYTPATGQMDSDLFTYEVSDGFQTVEGTIQIEFDGEGVTASFNIVSLTMVGDSLMVTANGIPGLTYVLESSVDLGAWPAVGDPLVCPPSGVMTFTDPNATTDSRFYRVGNDPNTGP